MNKSVFGRLLLVGLVVSIALLVMALVGRPSQTGAFVPGGDHVLHVAPQLDTGINFTGVQAAFDYASANGAWQGITTGTTEQGGTPWVVVLHPGVYNESGIVTRNGVNVTSLMERTVLITSSAASPLVTCDSDTTIAGVTIEQQNTAYPALLVTDNAIQCSLHRDIVANVTFDAPAIVQNGGFLRVFDTDIRAGRILLAPTVNRPQSNPVGMNFIRSRFWNGNFYLTGSNNMLLMIGQSDLGEMSVLSTATGHVNGKFYGNTNMGRVENSGTFRYLIRDSDISILAMTGSLSTAQVYGGFVENTQGREKVTWHEDARYHWLAERVAALEALH